VLVLVPRAAKVAASRSLRASTVRAMVATGGDKPGAVEVAKERRLATSSRTGEEEGTRTVCTDACAVTSHAFTHLTESLMSDACQSL
jgi:hypothetical protein